jgi:hypothetical protein
MKFTMKCLSAFVFATLALSSTTGADGAEEDESKKVSQHSSVASINDEFNHDADTWLYTILTYPQHVIVYFLSSDL